MGYYGKEYFCDRQNEIDLVSKNVKNGINTTLISIRRMGKSALIYRIFEELEEENEYSCIYADVFATQSLKGFTEVIAQMVLQHFPEKKGIWRRFFDYLKTLRPVISYDVLTGQPEVRFDFSQPGECERTLAGIFQFLERQDKQIVIAIDEFQQVANYREKNTEAVLRTLIQPLKNVRFVFCGSNKHLMTEMFNAPAHPFFGSTHMLRLSSIPEERYKDFIRQKFADTNRTISDEGVAFILSWTRCHTFYTQMVCNGVFALKVKNVGIEEVKRVCNNLLETQQTTYMQYRNLLSPVQWILLIAVAKEERVCRPQANDFLQKYKIGTPASSKRALEALLEKEMLYSDADEESVFYQVYDVFLSRWLQKTF